MEPVKVETEGAPKRIISIILDPEKNHIDLQAHGWPKVISPGKMLYEQFEMIRTALYGIEGQMVKEFENLENKILKNHLGELDDRKFDYKAGQ
ncbi:hypothetical protein AB3N61_09350 [Leptospira sp. WS58.C1]|uniref:hypothetical protein n=1 Tax=Leptospira cinconiae TaxID=3235173 RepID=UPI00349E6F19